MIKLNGGRSLAVALAAALLLGACDLGTLLDVETGDLVTPDEIRGARGADLFAAGALGQFNETFGGEQILTSGLMADEFHYASVFPPSLEIDQRAVDVRNGSVGGAYSGLHEARVGLENAADILEEFLPGDPRISEMSSLAGFTYVFFGEHFCSGVPFGRTLPSGEATQGVQQTTDQTFGIALDRFDAAAAATAGSADMAYLAEVGAARSLLNQGLYAAAAGRAAAVPTDWVFLIRYQSGGETSQRNAIFHQSQVGRSWSLSDREGGQGIAFRSDPDARVEWSDDGAPGANGETPLYQLTKYDSYDADVVLASGIEARLVEAEAALQSDDVPLMLTKLNELRATLTLGDLTDPGTLDARVDMLFSERARWTFATAHRLGDMRRLIRQYGRSAAAVFPTGLYHLGGDYGSDVDWGISENEGFNPNYSGCFNRGG